MQKLIKKAINPIRFFIGDSRSTGILLLFCTAISLILSNTIYGDGYRTAWNSDIHYSFSLNLPHSGLSWINNFLMAFFFLFADFVWRASPFRSMCHHMPSAANMMWRQQTQNRKAVYK